MKRCNESECCKPLAERLGDGKGFNALFTFNDDEKKQRFLGVAYKRSAKDRGLLLNWCPFCGGTPGYFKREEPALPQSSEAHTTA